MSSQVLEIYHNVKKGIIFWCLPNSIWVGSNKAKARPVTEILIETRAQQFENRWTWINLTTIFKREDYKSNATVVINVATFPYFTLLCGIQHNAQETCHQQPWFWGPDGYMKREMGVYVEIYYLSYLIRKNRLSFGKLSYTFPWEKNFAFIHFLFSIFPKVQSAFVYTEQWLDTRDTR